MKKSKNKNAKTIVVMILFAFVILGAFYRITESNKDSSNPLKQKTEVDKLLSKDIDSNYPASPREVIKLYSRISKSFYKTDLSDEKVNSLSDQVRKLYDDELLNNNQNDKYLENLKSEITEYKEAKREMTNYMIQNSDLVEYWEKEEQEYASLIASYTLKEKNEYKKTYEKFILRKDKNNKWKILGWSLTDKIDIVEE